MSTWCTPEQARELWADAPLDDAALTALLGAAQEICEAYAPALVEGDVVPHRYTEAVAMQAQDTWNAFQRDTGDVIGFADSGYAIRVRPLSGPVKALLRPHRAVPVTG